MKKALKRGVGYLYVDIRSGRILNPNYLSFYKSYPSSDYVWVTVAEYEFLTSSKRGRAETCADIYDKVRWDKKGRIWIEDDNTKKNILK